VRILCKVTPQHHRMIIYDSLSLLYEEIWRVRQRVFEPIFWRQPKGRRVWFICSYCEYNTFYFM